MLAGRCCRRCPGPDLGGTVAAGPDPTGADHGALSAGLYANDPGVYVLGNAVREVRYAELCYVDLCNR